MKKSLKLVIAAMLLLMSVAMSACSEKQDTSEQSVNVSADSIQTADNNGDVSASGFPLTVYDSEGNAIVIESEPQRIVSVAPNLTEIMYELGVQDKLIGRSDYCDWPEEALNIQSVGTIYEPDIELIIALDPDLVIVSNHFDVQYDNKLADAGIPVLTLFEEHELEGVYTMIETLGQVVNCTDRASQIIDEMKTNISEVEEKTADHEKPSVYYVLGFGDYGDYTATGDTYVADILEKAGADNIADEDVGWTISFEKIVEADPDYIFIGEDFYEEFVNTANYRDLRAVREGNVYAIDNNMLDRQGVRNDDAILEIAGIIYPDVF